MPVLTPPNPDAPTDPETLPVKHYMRYSRKTGSFLCEAVTNGATLKDAIRSWNAIAPNNRQLCYITLKEWLDGKNQRFLGQFKDAGFNFVCGDITEGSSIETACANWNDIAPPNCSFGSRTFLRWRKKDPGLEKAYEQALRDAAHVNALKSTDVAADTKREPKCREVEVKALQWSAERLNRRRYAPKPDPTPGAAGGGTTLIINAGPNPYIQDVTPKLKELPDGGG